MSSINLDIYTCCTTTSPEQAHRCHNDRGNHINRLRIFLNYFLLILERIRQIAVFNRPFIVTERLVNYICWAIRIFPNKRIIHGKNKSYPLLEHLHCMYKFSEKDIIHKLEILEDEKLDRLDFGVIGFNQATSICRYNRKEGEMSGYQQKYPLGKSLFLEIAPCMNNYRVALKFKEQEELDEVLPYIFSFKMKPVRVQLRLLKNPLSLYTYVLVQN